MRAVSISSLISSVHEQMVNQTILSVLMTFQFIVGRLLISVG